MDNFNINIAKYLYGYPFVRNLFCGKINAINLFKYRYIYGYIYIYIYIYITYITYIIIEGKLTNKNLIKNVSKKILFEIYKSCS